MSDALDDVITDIMKAEGWDKYTNRPNDRGGPTKWGITLKAYQEFLPNNDVTEADIRALKEVHARAFYRSRYIIGPKFDRLSPLLLPLVVDCAVNHGPHRATKWLQKAVGAKQDGVLGPKTLEATHLFSPSCTYLRICGYRTRFYGAIVTRDPTQAEFASGWNNRAAKWVMRLADMLESG
jgi:lysozyme family protein